MRNTSTTYKLNDLVLIHQGDTSFFLRVGYVDNFGICGSITHLPVLPDEVNGSYLDADDDNLIPWHTVDRLQHYMTHAMYEEVWDEWEERTTPKPDPFGSWADLAAKARQR